uniref:Uncharacterized protein n=1 Tax=Salix viminalis TaxID=40686 RepID=A0A6N2MH31_SALVM
MRFQFSGGSAQAARTSYLRNNINGVGHTIIGKITGKVLQAKEDNRGSASNNTIDNAESSNTEWTPT